ncbi:MAG: hypothetical protein N3B18_07530 [Desulfobacterota bacterium]|nr:hypothetical protein [Thermodesulfobacteriota bacterium]
MDIHGRTPRERRTQYLFVCCILLLLISCDNDRQGKAPGQKFAVKKTAEGVEVMTPDGSLRIAGNEKTTHIKIKRDDSASGTIEMRYQKGSLAPGFPPDIPIYTPAEITMSQCFQGRNALATLSTSDNMSKVAQFYRNMLVEKGFTLGEEVVLRDLILLHGEKDSCKLNISLKPNQGATVINLALTDQSQTPAP